MNANELAEELEMVMDGYAIAITASGMLRQQQAEIEALKKDNKELHAIAQRMAMAESDARKSLQWFKDAKEMNNEPIAWMWQDDDEEWVEVMPRKGIPFYTHPVKELNDAIETLKYLLKVAQEDFKTMNSHFVIEQVKQALKELSDE